MITCTASAYSKAQAYLTHGCVFSEFGTRRRRSYHIQDLVVTTLIRAFQDYQIDEARQKTDGEKGKLMGTSNVRVSLKLSNDLFIPAR